MADSGLGMLGGALVDGPTLALRLSLAVHPMDDGANNSQLLTPSSVTVAHSTSGGGWA